MNRSQYLNSLITLYLQQPDTPAAASRADWTLAARLHDQGVSLQHLTHAIRLATLRRLSRDPDDTTTLPPICSLAYYRHVLDNLDDNDLQPRFIDYIEIRYRSLLERNGTINKKQRPHRQKTALSDRR